MLRRRLAYIIPGLSLVLTTLLFIACGGNAGPLEQPQPGQQPQQQLPEQTRQTQPLAGEALPGQDIAQIGNLVSLRTPALAHMQAGTEFTAVLSLKLVEDAHQGVLRLLFDSQSMQPVEAAPGDRLPAGMLRIADLDKPGFIPLAFTALPEGQDLAAGSGELYRIRFRLLTDGSQAGRLSFSADDDFLQLRDRDGRHIRFDLSTEAGGSDVN